MPVLSDWSTDRIGPLDCRTIHCSGATVFVADADPGLSAHASDFLSVEERDEAARFRHDSDRGAYIAAHMLKRLALGRATGRSPRDLDFVRDIYGKPHLRDRAMHFNLSHCDGAVALALSPHAPVGIDVERLRPDLFDPEVQRIAFAPAELEQVEGVDRDLQGKKLLALWTLREAFVKATGEGLAQTESSFWFDLATLAVHDVPSAGQWRFRVWRLEPDLSLALAMAPVANQTRR